jgi:hypothetical protein
MTAAVVSNNGVIVYSFVIISPNSFCRTSTDLVADSSPVSKRKDPIP